MEIPDPPHVIRVKARGSATDLDIERVTLALGTLARMAVLHVAEFPAGVCSHWPDSVTDEIVILSSKHYLKQRPYLADHERDIVETLICPDSIWKETTATPGKERPPVVAESQPAAVFYRSLADGSVMRVPVAISSDRERSNAVITAYRTRSSEARRLQRVREMVVWMREN